MEGFSNKLYQYVNGVWIIGCGYTNCVSVTSAAKKIIAEALLREDVKKAEADILRHIHVPLSNHQFDALVSLVYNAGVRPLLHTLGKKLNAGDYSGAD